MLDTMASPTVQLSEAKEPAARPLRRILGLLLDDLVDEVEDIVADADIEALHDLRVAARRSRVAVSLLAKLVPKKELKPAVHGLKWLGTATGPCRDYDVLLEEYPNYRALLPVALDDGFSSIESCLVDDRAAAHCDVVAGLASSRFAAWVAEWRGFLDRPDPRGGRTLGSFAVRRIDRAFRRVAGRKVRAKAPAGDLHRLRIDCKKLRYKLEFFRGLYEAEQIDVPIRRLKRLQDSLGIFHDLDVHIGVLREMAAGGRIPSAGVAAADRLCLVLADERARRASESVARFGRFPTSFNPPG